MSLRGGRTMNVNLEHPANRGVLECLRSTWSRRESKEVSTLAASPASVRQPYERLGVHPDLVRRLWNELTRDLPESCQWIVYHRPALVSPKSGVIFGFALGTMCYGLRLDAFTHDAALETGATDSYVFGSGRTIWSHELGTGWVFGRWLANEPKWCLAAFEFANRL